MFLNLCPREEFPHPSLSLLLRNPGFLTFVSRAARLFACARSDTLRFLSQTKTPCLQSVFEFVPSRGIEPLLRDPQSRVLSVERRGHNIPLYAVRARRIELLSQPWQGRVLPLNHARKPCTIVHLILI